MRTMLLAATAAAVALTLGADPAGSVALSPGAANLLLNLNDHLTPVKDGGRGGGGNVGKSGGGQASARSGNGGSSRFVRGDGGNRGSARISRQENVGPNKNFRSGKQHRWSDGGWDKDHKHGKHHKRRHHRFQFHGSDWAVFGYGDPWWDYSSYDDEYEEECLRLVRRWIGGRRLWVRENICI